MSNTSIGIFVATMTGLADLCAQEVQAVAARQGWTADIHLMDDDSASRLEGYRIVVIVSSTYGHGDIPDNGRALYEALQNGGNLAGKAFAVYGLGDRTYADTFCQAGEKWDGLLESKGAARLCPLMRHDASSGTLAEDIAGAWAEQWLADLREAA